MYIQITTRCNMTCAHCCMNAVYAPKARRGLDMSMKTFASAIRLAEERGDTISIGGGEPTVHPKFWQMLGITLGSAAEFVWLATNGKMTETALALAGLAKGSERFGVALSQDRWHDPIDPRVVSAFKRNGLEIRTVTNIANVGRAKANGIATDDKCPCPGLMVRPNGDIFPCGCEDAPCIGNVNLGGIREEFMAALDDDDYRDSECWTS